MYDSKDQEIEAKERLVYSSSLSSSSSSNVIVREQQQREAGGSDIPAVACNSHYSCSALATPVALVVTVMACIAEYDL